jgi:hypothetical protein
MGSFSTTFCLAPRKPKEFCGFRARKMVRVWKLGQNNHCDRHAHRRRCGLRPFMVVALIKWLAALLGVLALRFALFTHHPAHCLEIAAVCFVVVVVSYLPVILSVPVPRPGRVR